MKRILIIVFLFLFPSFLFAQMKFESGYLIDAEKQRHECLLLNTGQEYKGEDFIYKIHKDSLSREIEIEKVIEFGIPGKLRFVRNNITLDISDNKIKKFSDTVNHKELESGHAFLLELVNSELASLYYFSYNRKAFYFYRKGDSEIQELVYKKYNVESVSGQLTEVLHDNTFQKQLGDNLPCSIRPKTIPYTRKALLRYFEKYIEEQGGKTFVIEPKTKGQLLIKAAGMYNQMSFWIQKGESLQSMEFEDRGSLGYGLEMEYLFPYNRNRFGIFAEANYGDFSSSYTNPSTNQLSTIDYKFVEIPLGISCRFNLTKDFRLLVKAGFVPNLLLNDSAIRLHNKANVLDVVAANNALVSFGLNYKRLNAELRVYSKRNITKNLHQKSELSQLSLRVSYNIFTIKGK